MADTVTSSVLLNGKTRYGGLFTNLSDGTGESAVVKVDISSLQGSPTSVKIAKVVYDIAGMAVKIAFDHTTDDTALILSGNGVFEFEPSGMLKDPKSAGGTGDIVFTTINASLNDSYTIYLELRF